MPAGWSTTGSSSRALLLGRLDPPLDVAHRVEILDQLRAVARPEPALEPSHLLGHRVENAAVLLQTRAQPRRRSPCCRCRRTAVRTPPAGCSPSAAAWSDRASEIVFVYAQLKPASQVPGNSRRFQRRARATPAGCRCRAPSPPAGRSRRRPGSRRLRCASRARRSGTRVEARA